VVSVITRCHTHITVSYVVSARRARDSVLTLERFSLLLPVPPLWASHLMCSCAGRGGSKRYALQVADGGDGGGLSLGGPVLGICQLPPELLLLREMGRLGLGRLLLGLGHRKE